MSELGTSRVNNFSGRAFFSEHFLNKQVLNIAIANVIFDLFIRTVTRKCQPFPTHGTPLYPKQTQAQ